VSWDEEWGFERLFGVWQLNREISGQGRMSGIAAFETVDVGRALYRESGELWLEEGTRLRGEQRYFYERAESGFTIHFHDTGELFERVTFEAGSGGTWVGRAEHYCKADVYRSEYLFRRDQRFEVSHQVHGPRKDFTIRTVYIRD
jgi:hypothetical protein